MITFIEGILESKQPARVEINVSGLGYEVFIPLSSFDRIGKPGERCRLLIHEHIREDSHLLFGFSTQEERTMFERLITISGIGPKLALSALSSLSVRELQRAVIDGDTRRLSSISGIGRKTAERMVVELRDKISNAEALEVSCGGSIAAGDERRGDAVKALIALGYKQTDAQTLIHRINDKITEMMSVEDIIRLTLTS